MILSGRDIKWYIETKKLVVTPVEEKQFRQNGIDLYLEDVDLERADNGHKYLNFSGFVLGATRERLELPDDLMAFVELRSTFARKGLLIPPTIVDAGFKGNLTIELWHCRSQQAPLGELVFHLIFAKTSSPCVPYDGKYQNQSGITGAL